MLEKTTMKPLYLRSILNFFGATNLGNGLWMLFSAGHWYENLPAGLHDTGPLNTHFVHDIGLIYSLCGIALVWCAQNLSKSLHAYFAVMLFFIGHALIHVFEILLGLLPPSHWLIDFPLIFVPAMILIGLLPSVRKLNEAKA